MPGRRLGAAGGSVQGGFMLVPETWELAARYEDFDQRAGSQVTLGVNRYLRGHGTRLQLNLSRFDGAGNDLSSTIVELGFVASL